MPDFKKKLFSRFFERVHWYDILFLMLLHALISYFLLYLAKEKELSGLFTFLYYHIVTLSTVGFGDLSPQTTFGRYTVAFFQIPFGLIIFGVFITKLSTQISTWIRQNMLGIRDYSDIDGHLLIFGWNARQTPHMLNLILADKKRKHRKIILCVENHELNSYSPTHEDVKFARLLSFQDEKELKRIAVHKASRIIIATSNDDHTFTSILSIVKRANEHAHISAWFSDRHKAELLKEYCPNVEASSSNRAEILVRTMEDPGTSIIQNQIFSTITGPTLFCLELPELSNTIFYSTLAAHLKLNHNATLIAISDGSSEAQMQVNPKPHLEINQLKYIYYISSERLLRHEINWHEMT